LQFNSGLTYENNLVVDPFVGSGTVAVASKKFNRGFTGCDNDKDAVNQALSRLRKEAS